MVPRIGTVRKEAWPLKYRWSHYDGGYVLRENWPEIKKRLMFWGMVAPLLAPVLVCSAVVLMAGPAR